MSGVEIWINPECSKCRSALAILDAEGAGYTVRYYLEQPPSVAELTGVLTRLGQAQLGGSRRGPRTRC